ncbi:hypothetical protein M8A51_19690 [Schlegelella sp. S2-27]|uniref:CHAT domain-containing protein n=1 Tax=Caldimonas mangrovi TaxID=2944811 RepID=A0ABT0YSP2_9BURK|nr:hypothetical protein [Caldimonas mangrovi]MCM5681756.1 hypothetical protein [Caldimonas mangrovi]
MQAYSTLDFGNPKDARTFEKGCEARGLRKEHALLTPAPAMDDLAAFFEASPQLVYFSGHFQDRQLWGDDRAGVVFEKDRVLLQVGDETRELAKGSGLRLPDSVIAVFWGGCSALRKAADVKVLRELFPKAALLGYSDTTGVAINDAMLGGGFIRRKHFFDRLPRGEITGAACAWAWMGAAQTGYAGGSMADRFRAVTASGQEWKLSGGQIVKGRRY